MRRLLVPVLLALLLLVSGCNSLGGTTKTDWETLTPAPGAQISTTESAPRGQVAPGLTRDALVNPEELLRHHEAQLQVQSHTSRREIVRRRADGTIRSVVLIDTESNETAARIRQSGTGEGAGDASVLTVDRWSARSVTYTSVTRGNETSYSVAPVLATDRQRLRVRSYSASLTRILTQLQVDVGTPYQQNGTTTYPLTTAEPNDLTMIRNVSFTGTVTEDGILTGYTLRYEAEQNGAPIGVTVRYGVRVVQTDPTRPDWLATARNATSGRES